MPAHRKYLLNLPPKTMGERIRYVRIKRGLSLAEVGVRTGEILGMPAGLSKSFMSLLENSRSKPSLGTLAAIAAALGTSMDFLLTGNSDARVTARRAKQVARTLARH